MASEAAAAPSEAAVTNCLSSFDLQSPAANTPVVRVLQVSSAMIYPFSSRSVILENELF